MRNVRIRLLLAATSFGVGYFALASPIMAEAGACGDTVHYYAIGDSGVGAWGTDVVTTMPARGGWFASSGNFSDVGAWVINSQYHRNAIEVGWYTGLSGNGQYQSNLLPYYTLDNGAVEVDNFNDLLTPSTSYHMTARESSHIQGYIEFGWGTSQDWRVLLNFNVPSGLNYSQGEVSDSGCTGFTNCSWMGYGPSSFERMDGYFCNNGCSSWATWAYINTCNDAPYGVTGYATSYSYGADGPNRPPP